MIDEPSNPHPSERPSPEAWATRISEDAERDDLIHFFDLSLDMLCVAGNDGYFKRVNPSWTRILGYSNEELLSRPYIEFAHPDDLEATLLEAKKLSEGIDTIAFENRYRCKDGSYKWLSWRAKSLFPKDWIYAAARDITDRKNAEEALHKALVDLKASHDELKASQMQLISAAKLETTGRLAAGVAHEVKNPLAILLLSVEYLSNVLPEIDETVATVLKDMTSAIQRADTIIRGLLDFSAPEELKLAPCDLGSVIEQALHWVRHKMALNHIHPETHLAPNLPIVAIDRNKILQVFVNLFSNAIDAMPNGGTLAIRCYSPPPNADDDSRSGMLEQVIANDRVIVVQIDDTGSGIPPEQLSKIFDPFFTTKDPGKGTGLGLTVSRNIIRLHGGSLAMANRPEGGVRSTLQFHAINNDSKMEQH